MQRWLGIDAGESGHDVVLLDEEGREERSLSVANRAKRIEAALRDLAFTAGAPPGGGVSAPGRPRRGDGRDGAAGGGLGAGVHS